MRVWVGVRNIIFIICIWIFISVWLYFVSVFWFLSCPEIHLNGKRCVSLCESAFSNSNGRKNRLKNTPFHAKKLGSKCWYVFTSTFMALNNPCIDGTTSVKRGPGKGRCPEAVQPSRVGELTVGVAAIDAWRPHGGNGLSGWLIGWLIGCMREFGWKSFLRFFSYANYFGFTRFHSLSEHVPFVHRRACGLGTAMVASLVPTNQAAEGGAFFHPSIQPLMIDGNCQVLLGLQVLRCLGWYHKGNLEGLVRIC